MTRATAEAALHETLSRPGVSQRLVGHGLPSQLVFGLGLALAGPTAGGAAISSTLFGVTARDPLVYGAVFVLVAVVSLLAVLVPGRRATRVDPLVALRAE